MEKIKIGTLPIMVKSLWCKLANQPTSEVVEEYKECPYDQGGYFILKGSEKVTVGQERIAFNAIYTFKTKEVTFPYIAEIRSRKRGI
jgi:DNA-directed RNA polymerase II subunit RPB2